VAEKREKRRIKRPRPEKKPAPRGCPPRWAWFFGGLLIGVFGSFLFYLYEIAPQQLSAPPVTNSTSQNALNYESYDFYKDLPQTEVKVVETIDESMPAEESEDVSINALQTPQTVAQAATLQVGSFRDVSIAQGLKNHLSSLDIEAYIEQAMVNGLSWHRVRVKAQSSQLAQLQAQLTQQNIPFKVVGE